MFTGNLKIRYPGWALSAKYQGTIRKHKIKSSLRVSAYLIPYWAVSVPCERGKINFGSSSKDVPKSKINSRHVTELTCNVRPEKPHDDGKMTGWKDSNWQEIPPAPPHSVHPLHAPDQYHRTKIRRKTTITDGVKYDRRMDLQISRQKGLLKDQQNKKWTNLTRQKNDIKTDPIPY